MSTESASSSEDPPEENPCVYFDRCGNVVPTTLSMCPQCLDEARRRQREFFEENPRATMQDYGEYLEDLGY